MNFLISLGMCSTPKLSKYYCDSHTKLPNELLLIYIYQDLLDKSHPLFKVNYFLNKSH